MTDSIQAAENAEKHHRAEVAAKAACERMRANLQTFMLDKAKMVRFFKVMHDATEPADRKVLFKSGGHFYRRYREARKRGDLCLQAMMKKDQRMKRSRRRYDHWVDKLIAHMRAEHEMDTDRRSASAKAAIEGMMTPEFIKAHEPLATVSILAEQCIMHDVEVVFHVDGDEISIIDDGTTPIGQLAKQRGTEGAAYWHGNTQIDAGFVPQHVASYHVYVQQ